MREGLLSHRPFLVAFTKSGTRGTNMRKTVSKVVQGDNGVGIGVPHVPATTEGIQIEGSERAIAAQMMGELTALQVQHSSLCERWAAVKVEFRTQQDALLKQIMEKKKSQSEWLMRIAKAHGINVDEPNVKWNLDTTTWTFNRL
jgi:hypothetical protein